jgi:hypothetical protein
VQVGLGLGIGVGLTLIGLAACGGQSSEDGNGGYAGSGAGGTGDGGVGGAAGWAGSPCVTPEGVRICGGTSNECGWVVAEECPGGGCARPFDRMLGGEAEGGLCFSDLPDNGSRACFGCEDGEVCIEREPGELVCVPESVCWALWQIGVRGACRYADLASYDGRPLLRLPSCPDPSPPSYMCGGPCPEQCDGFFHNPCSGRSPDHPQGFCFYVNDSGLCSLAGGGYTLECNQVSSGDRYCGVYQLSELDAPVAHQYGQCLSDDTCLALSAKLPGGFLCYDPEGKLVSAP